MRKAILVVLAVLISLAEPAIAQEAVTLGRYRLTVATAAGPGVQVDLVGQPELSERCLDEDGCEIMLRAGIPASAFLNGANARLFVSPPFWSVDGVSHLNGDSNPEIVLSVTSPAVGTCSLSDADNVAGDDLGSTFTLKSNATGTFALVCVLTVVD